MPRRKRFLIAVGAIALAALAIGRFWPAPERTIEVELTTYGMKRTARCICEVDGVRDELLVTAPHKMTLSGREITVTVYPDDGWMDEVHAALSVEGKYRASAGNSAENVCVYFRSGNRLLKKEIATATTFH